MRFTRAESVLPRIVWLSSTDSTNAALRDLLRDAGDAGGASGELPHGLTVATADQTAGRGRLGRGWVTPPGQALAVSVLIRHFGQRGLPVSWLPLIAGSAVSAALQPLVDAGLRVGVKWPNDVHVRDEDDAMAGRPGRKICGILCEMVGPDTIIVGMGVNLLIPEWELPTDRATSLRALGGHLRAVGAGEEIGAEVGALDAPESLLEPAGQLLADRVLADIGAELLRLVQLAGENPEAVRARVLRHSLTLGAEVRVHLPDGRVVDGRAAALADDGSLVVDLPTGGQLTVSAADIEHLR